MALPFSTIAWQDSQLEDAIAIYQLDFATQLQYDWHALEGALDQVIQRALFVSIDNTQSNQTLQVLFDNLPFTIIPFERKTLTVPKSSRRMIMNGDPISPLTCTVIFSVADLSFGDTVNYKGIQDSAAEGTLQIIVPVSGNFLVSAPSNLSNVFLATMTAAAQIGTLPNAATAGNGFDFEIWSDENSTQPFTIITLGGTIDGDANLIIYPGQRWRFDSDGANYHTMIIDQGKADDDTEFVINGDFQVAQKGADGAASFLNPAGGTITLDKHGIFFDGAGGNQTVAQEYLSQAQRAEARGLLGDAPDYYLRWNCNVAFAGQTFKILATAINDLRRMQSEEFVLSFAHSNALGAIAITPFFGLFYGTGGAPSAPDTIVLPAITSNIALGFYWGRFQMPDFATKTFGTNNDAYMRLQLSVGNAAGLHDFRIANWSFRRGRFPRQYRQRSYDDVLWDCLPYLDKSFPYGTAPATAAGLTGSRRSRAKIAGAVATAMDQVEYPRRMIFAPTITVYNPSAANAQIRNVTDGADFTVTAASNISDKVFQVTGTGNAGQAANEDLANHYMAEATLL